MHLAAAYRERLVCGFGAHVMLLLHVSITQLRLRDAIAKPTSERQVLL